MACAGGDKQLTAFSYQLTVDSTEERMKSVDRDFDPYGIARHVWTVSYVFMAFGVLAAFGRFWDEIHFHGLPLHILFRIIGFPLAYVCPLILSLVTRSYIRSALKENLVNERVAKNCEYWIGLQLTIVYIVIMPFITWY
jgi:hypothetical protein